MNEPIRHGEIASSVFLPGLNGKLSTYNGEKCSAEAAYAHYTHELQLHSHGVLGVTEEECTGEDLQVVHDGGDGELHEYHVSIDFGDLTTRQRRKIARLLRNVTCIRGWQYLP